MTKQKGLLSVFFNGIFNENPTLIQLLGMCPTLATSTTVSNGLGMGISATAVLVCSNVIISLLRKFIPEKIRIASYVVVIAGFVTMIEMILNAYFESLSKSLGLFIPLIVVNCIILARAESFASKNAPLPSAVDGLGMGLGFTIALCVLALFRELLGSGKIFGISVFGQQFEPAAIMILPPGGFLTLGILLGIIALIKNRIGKENI